MLGRQILLQNRHHRRLVLMNRHRRGKRIFKEVVECIGRNIALLDCIGDAIESAACRRPRRYRSRCQPRRRWTAPLLSVAPGIIFISAPAFPPAKEPIAIRRLARCSPPAASQLRRGHLRRLMRLRRGLHQRRNRNLRPARIQRLTERLNKLCGAPATSDNCTLSQSAPTVLSTTAQPCIVAFPLASRGNTIR
jgi:hypothetical protein